MAQRVRDLALFNLSIDSKLRGCDLVKLQVRDVAPSGRVIPRATVMQQKTGQPVTFELTEQTREAVEAWIAKAQLCSGQFLFLSRMTRSPHISTRQYARIVKSSVARIGLDPGDYGAHSMHRTKATPIYRRTKNLQRFSCCSVIPGHTKLESTVRYLGIEVDDALEMSEQTEV
ncbi:MAG: tyrosine-type recombinase/integrase [Gammaproteobacteria bacterium]